MARNSEPDDWTVRHHIYRQIVERERPPTVAETAAQLGMAPEAARAAFDRLHERHAIFLDPTSREIRIANPFSAVPTAFRVRTAGHGYWANCAWDALGIAAALARDVRIEAEDAASGEPIELSVGDGRLRHRDEIVHFAIPFRRWYDDLITT
jgi:hypothetical protein